MTTRRDFLTLAALGATATAAGCTARTGAGAPRPGTTDPLLVAVARGQAIVRGDRVQALGDAIASPDGRRVISATPAGPDTAVVVTSAASGQLVAARTLPGRWAPRVASLDGGYAAFTSPDRGGTTGYAPSAQARSSIAVLGPGGQPDYLDLPGNYVPDALSTSGTMYALDWLPAIAPDHYRVREINLTTRQPAPLLTRDKVPIPPGDEEEMRGEGRMAAFSPDLAVLYTLYTHQPGHEHTRDLISGGHNESEAFVHTLFLDQHWSYCIDLPDPFGTGPAAGHAVATAPNGEVYVADITGGRLAVIDPDQLTVATVAAIPTGTGTASATVGGAYLFLAAGSTVHAIARRNLAVAGSWTAGGAVNGLAVSADGNRLYAGSQGGVAQLDARTGTHLGSVPIPGMTGLLRRL